jgi:hypothetical protein
MNTLIFFTLHIMTLIISVLWFDIATSLYSILNMVLYIIDYFAVL